MSSIDHWTLLLKWANIAKVMHVLHTQSSTRPKHGRRTLRHEKTDFKFYYLKRRSLNAVSFRTINWFSLKTISRTFQVLCIKFKLKLCLNVLKPATAINALVTLFLSHNTYFRSVLSLEGKTGQVKNIALNQQQKFLLLRKLTTEIIHKSSFSFSPEKRKKNCQMVNTTFRTRLWLKLSNPGGRS